jgi:hypothetical protein
MMSNHVNRNYIINKASNNKYQNFQRYYAAIE